MSLLCTTSVGPVVMISVMNFGSIMSGPCSLVSLIFQGFSQTLCNFTPPHLQTSCLFRNSHITPLPTSLQESTHRGLLSLWSPLSQPPLPSEGELGPLSAPLPHLYSTSPLQHLVQISEMLFRPVEGWHGFIPLHCELLKGGAMLPSILVSPVSVAVAER